MPMSKWDNYLAWRKRMAAMTPHERAQLETNQWIWLRWLFSAVVCLSIWFGVVIYNEGHGFSIQFIIFFATMLWAAVKGWKLKIRRDRS